MVNSVKCNIHGHFEFYSYINTNNLLSKYRYRY